MTRLELKKWLLDNYHQGWVRERLTQNKERMSALMEATKPLDSSFSLTTRIYWVINDLTDFPKCEYCGSPIKSNVNVSRKRFPRFCSCRCAGLHSGEKHKGIPNVQRLAIEAEKRKARITSTYRRVDNSTVIIPCGLEVRGTDRILPGEHIHHIVYKIVRRSNGKYYIGHHSTWDPLDEYTGSGVAITKAISMFGIKEFYKEILYDFNTLEESCEKEKELVTTELSADSNHDCYNLKPGGYGGCSTETAKKAAATKKLRGYKMSDDTKRKIGLAIRGVPKSAAHRESLSMHHRSNRWLTIVFEDGQKDLRLFGTIPQIAKKYGIERPLKLRRRSMRGVFINGVRIKELEDPTVVHNKENSSSEI